MEYHDSTHKLLEQMQQMEDCLTQKIEGRCVGLERRFEERCANFHNHFTARCEELQHAVDNTASHDEERLIALEMARTEVEQLKPDFEKRLTDMTLEITCVNKFLERERRSPAMGEPGICGPYGSTTGRVPAGLQQVDGQFGHRSDQCYRDRESGYANTQTNGPVKGTYLPSFHRCTGFGNDTDCSRENMHSSMGRLPKINFPQFDGSQPQLWKRQCESYFEMYETEPAMWVKVASMHFSGRASRWLQSVEKRLRQFGWEEFCGLIHDRFGREQHESLIRKLFHIRQNGPVSEYVEQFASLVDELAAYESHTDPLYYVMRFVDGLGTKSKQLLWFRDHTTWILLVLSLLCRRRLWNPVGVDALNHQPARFGNRDQHLQRQLGQNGYQFRQQ